MQLGSSIADYNYTASNQARLVSQFQKSDATVQRNVAYATANFATVTSPDDLLKNYRLLSVALGAYGLGDIIGQTAIVKKLLTQDPTSSSSLAQQFVDPRYLSFAKGFASLQSDGGAALRTPAKVNTIIQAYVQNAWQTSVGNDNMAVRQALYFTQNIGRVTSIYGILSDRTLSAVMRGALGLPDQFSALDPSRQVAMLSAKGFDVSKFQDPAYTTKFVDKFLALADINAGGYAASTPASQGSLLSLFNPVSGPTTIDISQIYQSGVNILV